MTADTNSLRVTPPEAMTKSSILSARNITVQFPRPDQPALVATRNFSIDIHAGEFVGMMGQPGCGKSTAAMALMGLTRPPGEIVSGSIVFGGRDILKLPEAERRKICGGEIGLIVQNPRLSLHPLLTVGQQISNVIRAHEKVSSKAAWARSIEMLKSVGINDPERRVSAYAHELSTGMTQRVLIAMALSSNPRLLIADEPTSGLDVTIQTQFLDNMWKAAQSTGSAVLLVTQSLGIVANYCDRVLIMDEGAIVEDAPVRQFFEHPQHVYSKRVMALQTLETGSSVSQAAKSSDITVQKPLIQIDKLKKDFRIRGSRSVVHAIDSASLSVRPGECLGLVGESGSGKTTVGRCLLQLEEPTSGDIVFNGEVLSDLSEELFRPYRARMQIVFQDPLDSMNPRWTVQEVIAEPLEVFGHSPGAERMPRIDDLLGLVGLDPSVKTMRPRQLSAGLQQRVAIARALATKPSFLVLDEPTSALTPETTAEILQLLMGLSRTLKLAMLFISHDLTTVKYVCHRVAVMYLGQIVEIGSKEQVFSAPAHPYTRALLAAHLFPDINARRVDSAELQTLQGEIPSPIDLPKGCYLYGRCPSRLDRCKSMPQNLEPIADGRDVRCWRVAAGELAVIVDSHRPHPSVPHQDLTGE